MSCLGDQCHFRAGAIVGIDQDQPPVIQRTYADDAIWNIDDRYRDPVVSGRTETESDAHVNNGHDDAVQIGHAFDEIGTAGNAGPAS